MTEFRFTHFGKAVTIIHNLPEKRFKHLYEKWSYESGRTDPKEFVDYINSIRLHRILGLFATLKTPMHTV